MNQALSLQRQRMQALINCINKIEECADNIAAENKPDYYRAVKVQAVDDYIDEMATLVGDAIELSKVQIPEA